MRDLQDKKEIRQKGNSERQIRPGGGGGGRREEMRKLTATVEPFLPMPPLRMSERYLAYWSIIVRRSETTKRYSGWNNSLWWGEQA